MATIPDNNGLFNSALTSADSHTDLNSLAESIRKEWRNAEQQATAALHHAGNVGGMLIRAKSAVGHGQWERWVSDNCPFGPRQARKLMRLAGNWDRIETAKRNSGSDFASINEALKLIAEPTSTGWSNPLPEDSHHELVAVDADAGWIVKIQEAHDHAGYFFATLYTRLHSDGCGFVHCNQRAIRGDHIHSFVEIQLENAGIAVHGELDWRESDAPLIRGHYHPDYIVEWLPSEDFIASQQRVLRNLGVAEPDIAERVEHYRNIVAVEPPFPERWLQKLESLLRDPHNVETHTDEEIEAIVAKARHDMLRRNRRKE